MPFEHETNDTIHWCMKCGNKKTESAQQKPLYARKYAIFVSFDWLFWFHLPIAIWNIWFYSHLDAIPTAFYLQVFFRTNETIWWWWWLLILTNLINVSLTRFLIALTFSKQVLHPINILLLYNCGELLINMLSAKQIVIVAAGTSTDAHLNANLDVTNE